MVGKKKFSDKTIIGVFDKKGKFYRNFRQRLKKDCGLFGSSIPGTDEWIVDLSRLIPFYLELECRVKPSLRKYKKNLKNLMIKELIKNIIHDINQSILEEVCHLCGADHNTKYDWGYGCIYPPVR